MKDQKNSELTDQQRLFCLEYLKDFNGTKAALRAGYAEKSARMQASRLLTNDNVCTFIAQHKKKIEKKVELDATWVLRKLKKVVKRCMQEEVVLDHEGNPIGEFRFEHSGANKSLELIGKHLGMFTDKIQHTGKDGGAIELDINAKHTVEEINTRIGDLLGKN